MGRLRECGEAQRLGAGVAGLPGVYTNRRQAMRLLLREQGRDLPVVQFLLAVFWSITSAVPLGLIQTTKLPSRNTSFISGCWSRIAEVCVALRLHRDRLRVGLVGVIDPHAADFQAVPPLHLPVRGLADAILVAEVLRGLGQIDAEPAGLVAVLVALEAYAWPRPRSASARRTSSLPPSIGLARAGPSRP